jgi:hypothetical protein
MAKVAGRCEPRQVLTVGDPFFTYGVALVIGLP